MNFNLSVRDEEVNSGQDVEMIGGNHEDNINNHSNEAGGFNFRRISLWFIYALVFLMPVFILPGAYDIVGDNKQLLLVILAGAAGIFYLMDIIKTGVFVYRPSVFYLPITVFLGLVLLSSLFSVNKYISFLGGISNPANSFVTMVFLSLVFFVGINVADDKGGKLRDMLTASLSLSLLLATLQVFGINIFSLFGSVGREFNTVGSLNMLGMLVAVILPLFMLSSSSLSGVRKKGFDIVRFIGLVLAAFVLILVNWWPVWLVAFVSLVFWMMFKVFETRKIKMSIFAGPLAVVVIGAFLLIIKFSLPIKDSLPVEVSVSSSASMAIAKSALNERLIFGFGPGNFSVAYDKFKPADIANSSFSQVRFYKAATEAFNFVIEGGVVVLVSILFFAWFLGLELFRRFKGLSSGGDSSSSTVPLIVSSVVLAFLYPLNIVLMFIGVVVLLLFALSSLDSDEKRVELESSPLLSLVGSLLFIVVLVGALAGGYFVANKYLGSLNYAKALSESSSDAKIESLVNAVNYDNKQSLYSRELSRVVIARLAEELKRAVPKEKQQEQANIIENNIVSAVDIAKRATDVDPTDARNWANRGFVYQNLMGLVGGAENIAVDMYVESLKRNPNHADAHIKIADINLAISENFSRILSGTPRTQISTINDLRSKITDNLNKAVASYQEAIKLNNNNGKAIYSLAAAYERLGNLPQAIQQLERIRAVNSRDPSIVFQLGLLYYRNNQKDAALAAWQQAVTLFPDYSNARWYLSLVLEERGDLAGALAQVREVERLNPDIEMVRQRVEQLQSGIRLIPPGQVLDQQPL